MGPPSAWPASLSALFTEANLASTIYDESELCGPYIAPSRLLLPLGRRVERRATVQGAQEEGHIGLHHSVCSHTSKGSRSFS